MSLIFSISVAALTMQALIVAAVATVVLLFAAFRKPARAQPTSPRGNRTNTAPGIMVDHQPVPLYRRPSIFRRLFALAGTGALGVLLGVLAAIFTAFSFAAAIIYLTNLLGS